MARISKEALRDYLRESLFGYTEPGVVNVNPVVDQSAAMTDPTNTNFSPQSKAELNVAIQDLINSSEKEPDEIYTLVKHTLSKSEEQTDMKNQKESKLENAIRDTVKKLLNEIGPEGLPPVRKIEPGVSAKDDPTTTAGQKSLKYQKDLKTKLEKMNVDEIFTEKDVKNFSRITEKVADTTEQLIVAVLKKIIEDFKDVVQDYNKSLDKSERFNLQAIDGLNKFMSQYVMFMSHVRRTASDADWNLIKPELEKIHTKLVDPSYVIYSGEKISNLKVLDQVKKVEQPLRSWLIETGKRIKEFEELRGDGGTKRINISKEMFYRPLGPYFLKLGLSESDVSELIAAISDSMADESPANMTNILSQKLVLTAFFTRWEVDINEREIVDGVMLKDLFTEKQASRGATFARGALEYSREKSGSRQRAGADLPAEDLFDILVSRSIYALENELNQDATEKFMKQGIPVESLERVANEWKGDTFDHIVDQNQSYKDANFSKDEVLDLIANVLADYSNVEIDLQS